jgi:O-antigen/teichoic acid export membrane protein
MVAPTVRARFASRADAGRDIVDQLTLRGANLAIGIATTVLLVRGLGESSFGEWATLFAILGLSSSFGLRGLSNVAVERATADDEGSARWVGSLVTLRLALSPPLTLISLAICLLVADSTRMAVAAVIIHTTLLTSSLASARVIFQLNVRNAAVTFIELLSGIAWGVGVFLVAWLDGGLFWMAVVFATVNNVTNLAQFWLSHRAQPIAWRGSRANWQPLVRLGLPVALASLLTMGYGRIDQVLVYQLAGNSDAGLYGSAYRIFDRLQMFPATLMLTLFPILVAARDVSVDRTRIVFNTAIDYLVLVSLPAFAVFLVGSEPLTVMLFGEEFRAAAPALPILTGALVVVSLGYLFGYLIITYGLQRQLVVVALAALVFNVVANLIFVPRAGFVAAAWITLLTEVGVLALSMTMVCRRMGLWPTGIRLPRIVAASFWPGLVAWGLLRLDVPTIVWAVLAAASYPAALLAFRAVRLDDVRTVFRRTPNSVQAVGE